MNTHWQVFTEVTPFAFCRSTGPERVRGFLRCWKPASEPSGYSAGCIRVRMRSMAVIDGRESVKAGLRPEVDA